jgi:glycosyltransferase involved in cell wall biosynthesis
LHSIEIQDFNNFEVVITDDSGNDDIIKNYLDESNFSFSLIYVKNNIPLGSPKNWLESFKYANGEWIKIMHDDDAFSSASSLSDFSKNINNDVDVIFSGFQVFDESTTTTKDLSISQSRFNKLIKNPFRLFSSNELGHPSVMIFRKSIPETFDERFTWIVDWEYYIRLLKNHKVKFIPKPLVVISKNETQLTNVCFRNASIEIPEMLMFYDKHGHITFNQIITYDAWWRFVRNLSLRSIEDITRYSGSLMIPQPIIRIIKFQSKFPKKLLSIGIISKLIMFISFISKKH